LEAHTVVGATFNVETNINKVLFASEAEGTMHFFLEELAIP
jgi:hypothetical protein